MRTRTVITPAGGVSPGGGPRHRRPGNGAEIAGTGMTESLVITGELAAGAALLGPGGEVLAVARAVWITVPRPAPALATEGTS